MEPRLKSAARNKKTDNVWKKLETLKWESILLWLFGNG